MMLILALVGQVKTQVIGQTPCLCQQVLIQSVCQSIPYCKWDTTCVDITIVPTMTPQQCYAAGGCMPDLLEDDDMCAPFTSCKSLFCSEPSICAQMNPTCTHTGGDYCTSIYSETCNIDECDISQEGYCYEYEGDKSGYKCGIASSCNNFNDYSYEKCPVGSLCALSPENRCVAQTCENTYGGQCTFIAYGFTPSTSRVEACILSTTGTERTCSLAQNTLQLNTPALCNTNTNSTYTWNNTDPNSGSCVICGYLRAEVLISAAVIILI